MVGKDTSRRAGLTHERVIDCACTLTREHGLQNWTIRDLATALDVVPSVIYHYFPTKTQIHDQIRDQICAELTLPDTHLNWQEWFTQALTALRDILLRYTGLTRHVMDSLEHGLPPRPLIPFFETAIVKLTEAGLEENAIPAYTMIVNVALDAIEHHDRQSPLSSNHHDITAMVNKLEPLAKELPALAMMRDDYLAHLPTPSGERISERYFRLLIRSLLTGIEQELMPQHS
ncbi:TetR/AcrR family transcriptional regulator [Dermatophilus congolensis]|uniref:TetR/AcrR family transcriptional regulator n=1 Tax=Dermatophilus congolensis TaxID=1863 RepID=UPI001AAEEE38|nr:TetR/AcrR family transcriptional regulator [Dermatophilus congolensis]MBO3142737.1 TetR family transcriptional regulator [Dermatophilus congolensis]MBO3151729.1 TetR family transcriptional regulator [Dermatophilus congolensis]MBO3161270.1 TetR family transcriptional regulator [Dermatophilus congolensis]MBO3163011.1 TetR family transcriptional regulator [Dermatophilus congolensis]MBO3176563.1 TetR family transcriptional regulator [Dermatophilus congolensis]